MAILLAFALGTGRKQIAACAYPKPKPNVLIMEPAEDRYRCDAAELLGPPKTWSIFIQ
jgi:hypothetical protein